MTFQLFFFLTKNITLLSNSVKHVLSFLRKFFRKFVFLKDMTLKNGRCSFMYMLEGLSLP